MVYCFMEDTNISPQINTQNPKPSLSEQKKRISIFPFIIILTLLPITIFFVARQKQLADVRTQAKSSPCPPAIGTKCTNGESGTYQGKCVIYTCPYGCGGNGECGVSDVGVTWEFKDCSSARIPANSCGQIDTVDENLTYCLPEKGCDVVDINCSGACEGEFVPTPTSTLTPTSSPAFTPTPTITPTISSTPSIIPTSTHSPTPSPQAAQCTKISLYKGESVISPSSIKPGDTVKIAVAHTNAIKARIRVNGGDFTETQELNEHNEFTISFSVPSGVTNFTIEAEVYKDGVWK